MALIEREFIASKKEQLNVRLDPEVMELLNRYCAFLSSGQNYVVEQSLRYMFAKDRDFQNWLSTQGAAGGSDSMSGSSTRSES